LREVGKVPTEDTLAVSAADVNARVVSLVKITQAPAGTKKAADISTTFVVLDFKNRALRSPAVPIPAIIPRATVVCVWTPITGTIVTAGVCGSVAVVVVRWGIAAAIIAVTRSAVIAVTRSAVIAVTRAIRIGAGGYATDHRTGNQSAR
jgi:hypothetical protein